MPSSDLLDDSSSDRRRAARRAVRWPAMLLGHGVVRDATCVDVSSSGVALQLESSGVGEQPTVGVEVTLVLQPAPTARLVLAADVVRASSGQLGVRVRKLTQEALDWLHVAVREPGVSAARV